jgi:hypothetical protein
LLSSAPADCCLAADEGRNCCPFPPAWREREIDVCGELAFGIEDSLMESKMSQSKSRKKYKDLFMTRAVEMKAQLENIPGLAQELQINVVNPRRWIADPRNSLVFTQGP